MIKNLKYRPSGTHNRHKYNEPSNVIIPFQDQCYDAIPIPYALKMT